MAVRADDVALGDLIEDALPTTIAESHPDGEVFVAEVVEFEHERIRLTAVDAWMRGEVVDEVSGALRADCPLAPRRVLDVASAIGDVMLMVAVRPARPAVVVSRSTRFASPRELVQRL
jgi:hypothetical protein